MAYFICEDSKAQVNDDSGLNTWGLMCDLSNFVDFPSTEEVEWPQCVRDTECANLPQPSEESRLQKAEYIGESVRIGEYIRYVCIDKDLFYETPQVTKKGGFVF